MCILTHICDAVNIYVIKDKHIYVSVVTYMLLLETYMVVNYTYKLVSGQVCQ